MPDDKIKKYLEDEITAHIDKVNRDAEFLASLTQGSQEAGRAKPLDLQVGLACYRGLVEAVTLLRAYNANYEDANAKELQGQFEPILEATEKAFSETIGDLVG